MENMRKPTFEKIDGQTVRVTEISFTIYGEKDIDFFLRLEFSRELNRCNRLHSHSVVLHHLRADVNFKE